MAKWFHLSINKKYIIFQNETSSLINVPSTIYKFWYKNKILKGIDTKSQSTVSLLYTTTSKFFLFKSKQVNNAWENYDEKTFSSEDFLQIMNNDNIKVINFSISKIHIKKQISKACLIGFFTKDYNYSIIWIPKQYISFSDSYVRLILPIESQFKILTTNSEDDEETELYLNADKTKEYIVTNIDEVEYNKYLIPDILEIPQNIQIDSSLKDDNYYETGVLQTRTQLFDYQEKAIAKILPSRYNALFMDMGTGKTRTSLEIIKIRQKKFNKLFWITPVALKFNVFLEFIKHTNLKKEDIYFFNSKTTDSTIIEQKFIIVGLEAISSSDRVHLALKKFITDDDFVVVDESSFIKGNSKRARRITQLAKDTRYRMILTGTPISQGIVDLYSQISFLSKKILGYKNFYQFAKNHLQYSRKFPGMIVAEHNESYIAAKINPYVYQIKKEECLDLKEKIYITKYFEMSDNQYQIYTKAKEDFFEDFISYEETSIFTLFSKLQQIVSGFKYLDNNKHEYIDDSRLIFLGAILKEIEINRKIIIWAKYTYNINEIAEFLKKEYGKDSYVVFNGSSNDHEKSVSLERFKNDSEVRFFVSNQATGAFGLNLTEATYSIFYNNSFKYSERIQAEDRNHRIGQDESVTYIDIVCNNSIDVKIDNTLFLKENVVSSFKRELEEIKDKKLKKAILSAIIDGRLDEVEKIKRLANKTSAAKRMEKHRRAKGVIPRKEFLEKNPISKIKPWEKLGVSRATWYRLNKKKDRK